MLLSPQALWRPGTSWVSRFPAKRLAAGCLSCEHLTVFQHVLGDSAAISTGSRCACRSAYFMMRSFLLRASLHATQLSFVCRSLCSRWGRSVSARMFAHCSFQPLLDFGERLLVGTAARVADERAPTVASTYRPSAAFVVGVCGSDTDPRSVSVNFSSSMVSTSVPPLSAARPLPSTERSL